MTGDWRGVVRGLRARLADRDERLAVLGAEDGRLRAEIEKLRAESVHHPAGPLGDVYFYQCPKCEREKQIDISPARVLENHTMQLAEDDHRARLHALSSPEADRARAMAAAEIRDAAEAKDRQRTREIRAEQMRDRADLVQLMSDGPWPNQNNDSGGQAAPSSTGWGEE